MSDDKHREQLLRPIGERVRKAREEAGLSRMELARLIGLSEGNPMYKYETGRRALGVLHIAAIAEATGKTCDWLITGREPAAALKGIAKVSAADIAEPMLELINLGWLSLPIEDADLRAMRTHLANGYPTDPKLLALAVRSDRLLRNGTDENLRLMNEAAQRHTSAFRLKRLDEPEGPAPATGGKAAANSTRHQPPRGGGPDRRRRMLRQD